jgi:Na+/phosphate symporter
MITFDDCVKKMQEDANSAHECLALLQTALSRNSAAPLKDCERKIALIRKTEAELTEKITHLAQENHTYRMYLSIPPLLLRIGEQVEKLSETIHKKIKEDVLFSDRAISELTILFQRLKEALKSTSDLLATKNPVLVQHITECEDDVVKKALEYATLHEERLIEGLCLAMASPLFLNILNSVRCIAWDAKEIATKFKIG